LGFDDKFIGRLLAEPAAQGILVLDPVSRFTGTDTSSMLSHDGIQPNQQGELALSSALVDSLLDHSFALNT
jgi:hypothetical protein